MSLNEAALSELSTRLIGTGSNLTNSLSEFRCSAAGADRGRADHGDRRRPRRAHRGADGAAQRASPEAVVDPGGDVEVGIPKLRTGSFFPELLEPRRRIDKALWAVIMTAYITGTSTRKVDDLVKALGCDSGVSKSTVSRICAQIDADVAVLRTRRLDHQPFVYVWLDATYVHVREHRHVVSKAVVIATGLRADGHREVLGLDVGDSENETFWREFLTGLTDRGLAGVRLVVSDAHAGLIKAIRRCFQGAAWQRCRVHAMRNLLSAAHHRHRQVIAALIRTVFAQPDADTARTQLRAVVDQLDALRPGGRRAARRRWRPTCSPTPASRRRTGRRSGRTTRSNDSTGSSSDAPTSSASSPTRPSVIRLVGALLVEINDEMIAAERRYIAAASVAELTDGTTELALPAAPRT